MKRDKRRKGKKGSMILGSMAKISMPKTRLINRKTICFPIGDKKKLMF